MKHRRTIFHDLMGPVRFPLNACQDTFRRTCVFSSGAIGGSHSAFPYIRATKHSALFFMFGWAWCGFRKKRIGTHYAKLVSLHPVVSVGHLVNFCVSRPQNIDTQFCMLG
jgi:hypothetical protein